MWYYTKINKKIRNELIKKLVEQCFILITDQFWKFLLQRILLLKENEEFSAIVMKICDNILYYSKHRYSSNVIEKCRVLW